MLSAKKSLIILLIRREHLRNRDCSGRLDILKVLFVWMQQQNMWHLINFIVFNYFFIFVNITPANFLMIKSFSKSHHLFLHLFTFRVPNGPEKDCYHFVFALVLEVKDLLHGRHSDYGGLCLRDGSDRFAAPSGGNLGAI